MSDKTRVAFLVAGEGVERAELVEPWAAVEQADLQLVLISP
jgi:protease I